MTTARNLLARVESAARTDDENNAHQIRTLERLGYRCLSGRWPN